MGFDRFTLRTVLRHPAARGRQSGFSGVFGQSGVAVSRSEQMGMEAEASRDNNYWRDQCLLPDSEAIPPQNKQYGCCQQRSGRAICGPSLFLWLQPSERQNAEHRDVWILTLCVLILIVCVFWVTHWNFYTPTVCFPQNDSENSGEIWAAKGGGLWQNQNESIFFTER